MRHFKHTPEPANALYHTLGKIAAAQPRTFNRTLSWDEQRALSPADEREYWGWIFDVNERVCRRREREQSTLDAECTDSADPYNTAGPHQQSRGGE